MTFPVLCKKHLCNAVKFEGCTSQEEGAQQWAGLSPLSVILHQCLEVQMIAADM